LQHAFHHANKWNYQQFSYLHNQHVSLCLSLQHMLCFLHTIALPKEAVKLSYLIKANCVDHQ
jgi:hypothetical protein